MKKPPEYILKNSFVLKLVFGGGRRKFLTNQDSDYFETTRKGDRVDTRSLIDEWGARMSSKKLRHKFLWNLTDFNELRPNQHDHILGLFSFDHMSYELDRVEREIKEPSLVEMTRKAIELLETNPNGYFLFVEGANIDRGHHASMAKKSLHEFVQFDNAVGVGVNSTSEEDTLLTVTADHSHV